MNRIHRRSFLKTSLLTTTSFSLFPALGAEQEDVTKAATAESRVPGANGGIRSFRRAY